MRFAGVRLTGLIALAGFVPATIGASLFHDHSHTHSLDARADVAAAGHSHSHHGHRHAHSHSTEGTPHEHAPVPVHPSDDDCAACQFLLKQPIATPKVALVATVGFVVGVEPGPISAPDLPALSLPPSRGPPRTA